MNELSPSEGPSVELIDDPDFHLEVGLDIASRTWIGWESLDEEQLREVGRSQLQDADYGRSARATIVARIPQLARKLGRPFGG